MERDGLACTKYPPRCERYCFLLRRKKGAAIPSQTAYVVSLGSEVVAGPDAMTVGFPLTMIDALPTIET
jgi:hypothetical protein